MPLNDGPEKRTLPVDNVFTPNPPAPFVEFGVASAFSFLRGASEPLDMVVAANALGYDAQWLTEWYAFDEALKSGFGAADSERIAGFIHIGTRTMPKTERARPVISEVLSLME